VGTHRRKCYFITSAYFSALTVESPVARFPLSGLLRKLDSNMALEENNWIPAAVFGGSLVLLGAGMMYGHARAWQQQRADESLEDAEIEEFEAVSEAIEGAEVEDADFSEQDARDTAKEAAKTIAGIAMKFAARDGSKLAGVDEFMNDEVVELKGKAYSRTP